MSKPRAVPVEAFTWCDQTLAEQLTWLRGVDGIKDENLLDAYALGFVKGWQQAISTLQLHGVVGEIT